MSEEQNCYSAALEGLKTSNEDELRLFAKKVFARAKSIDPSINSKALEEARLQVYRESLEDKLNDAQRLANSAEKIKYGKQDLVDNKVSLIRMMNKRDQKMGDAIPAHIESVRQELYKHLIDPLNPEKLAYFQDDVNELEIGRAHDGDLSVSPMAKEIGQLLQTYFPKRNALLYSSDAMGLDELRDDRLFKTNHNADRIACADKYPWMNAIPFVKQLVPKEAALKYFHDTIVPLVNIEKSFPTAIDEFGNVNEKEVANIVENIFYNIINPHSNIDISSAVVNDANALKKLSQRTFVFDKLENQILYNQKLGQGTLWQMVMRDINSSAKRVGIAQKFGANPDYAYNQFRRVEEKSDRTHPFAYFSTADNYYQQLRGDDLNIVHPTIANASANLRSITSMARLGDVVIKSLSDIHWQAANATRYGANPFKAYFKHIINSFDLIHTDDRKYVAQKLKYLIDPQLGYIGRFNESMMASSLIDKATNSYFRKIGMHAWDYSHKVTANEMLGNLLYDQRNTEYGKLNLPTKNFIDKFLTPDEWEGLRTKAKVPGVKIFNMDAPNELSHEELRSLWNKSDKRVSIDNYQSELRRKLMSMYYVNTERTVISPTETEGLFRFNTKQGTAPRTLYDAILQFKQFGIGTADRVYMQGFKDAVQNGNLLNWAIPMFLGSIPLSLLSNYLDAKVLGKDWEFPDFGNMNGAERAESFVDYVLPSFGLLSGIFKKRNQDNRSIYSVFQSPTISFLSYGLNVGSAGLTGDLKGALKNAKDMGRYMLPLQNVPIISPILQDGYDYMMNNPPAQPFIYGGTRSR